MSGRDRMSGEEPCCGAARPSEAISVSARAEWSQTAEVTGTLGDTLIRAEGGECRSSCVGVCLTLYNGRCVVLNLEQKGKQLFTQVCAEGFRFWLNICVPLLQM